jgi:hypothetical protein
MSDTGVAVAFEDGKGRVVGVHVVAHAMIQRQHRLG